MLEDRELDILIVQDETYDETFQYREDDEETEIDLTGWTAYAQIRTEQREDADLLGTFTCTVNGPIGEIDVVMAASITGTIDVVGFWDLFIVSSDVVPVKKMIAQGRALLERRVTVTP